MPNRGSVAISDGPRIVRVVSGERITEPPRSRSTLEREIAVCSASSIDMSHHCCGAALRSIVRGSGVKRLSLGGVVSCG
jgi:hypothetical protein